MIHTNEQASPTSTASSQEDDNDPLQSENRIRFMDIISTPKYSRVWEVALMGEVSKLIYAFFRSMF